MLFFDNPGGNPKNLRKSATALGFVHQISATNFYGMIYFKGCTYENDLLMRGVEEIDPANYQRINKPFEGLIEHGPEYRALEVMV